MCVIAGWDKFEAIKTRIMPDWRKKVHRRRFVLDRSVLNLSEA